MVGECNYTRVMTSGLSRVNNMWNVLSMIKEINVFRIVIYQPVILRTLSSQEASFLDCEILVKVFMDQKFSSANNCFRMLPPFEIAVLNF